ncbi:U3 small nucleolar RNA-associated protein [Achlya hypogyna]|uniref:U3 small nucleolar RNA-associated protein n=1 Tax=Achlya hypogyna TaxID=1202772 RepID=A0A1V9YVX2_ACHHY|nr:U3 small nucleolar RNA-associated protein [Achlya hypogyna]
MAPQGKKKRSAAAVAAPAPAVVEAATTEEDGDEEVASSSIFTMCKVHRCRFIKHEPSTITSLAYNTAGDRLAVARQSGNVELWRVSGRDVQLDVVVGGRGSAVISSLQWTSADRLFAASLDGTIREVDLDALRFVNSLHANGGPIWCMQYHAIDNMLAVGCEDGRIRLFTMTDDEPLYFHKVFGGTGRRVVSIAWHGRTDTLFSGNDEGVIYMWNAKTGRNESRMTLERFAKQDPAVVWSLLVLDDLTVLSGDSNGNVHTWDGVTGTLMQTFAQLTADVLTMALDPTESYLFASGIDNQVIHLRRSAATKLWSYAYSHRPHTHDVRALAVSRHEDGAMLVSGGVDTHLVTYVATKFNATRPHKVSPLPQHSYITLAGEKRLLVAQHTNAIDVWRIDGVAPKLLTHIKVAGANVVATAVSPNGQFIACSTSSELKLFRLQGASVTKVALPASVAHPAHALFFTADSARLITGDTVLRVVDMATLNLRQTLATPHGLQTKTLSASGDGQWVACGDYGNNISVFNLDSMTFYADFPRPSAMHSALGFHPTGKTLVVTTVANHVAVYDVEHKCLTEWSREYATKLPKELLQREAPLKGVLFHPTQPNSIVLWSQRYLLHIDTERAIVGQRPPVKRRRTLSVAEDTSSDETPAPLAKVEPSYGFIRKYGPIAFADYVVGSATPELVLVETPFVKMLHSLPDALQRRKYGQ